jgi:hypothetical protein
MKNFTYNLLSFIIFKIIYLTLKCVNLEYSFFNFNHPLEFYIKFCQKSQNSPPLFLGKKKKEKNCKDLGVN